METRMDHSTPRNRHRRAGNLVSDSVAALLSSSLFATTFYPLHRVKILLQTQDSNPLVQRGTVPRYTVLDALPRLVREGGPRELWRGNAAYMMRHVPSTTLSFAFKDALLRLAPPFDAPEQLHKAAALHVAAGFVGGAAALLLVYPLDFATIRMASELRQNMKAQGVMDTLHTTQRAGGVAALYRGYGISALAIGSYKALYFGLYDTACAIMEHRNATSAATRAVSGPSANPAAAAAPPPAAPHHAHAGAGLGLLERWLAANVVVVTASGITYPLDVVRKRLVADTALGAARQYAGVADCVAKIARREGLRGFYRFFPVDMSLRMGGGVLLVTYDEVKSHGALGAARKLLATLAALRQQH